MPVVDVVMVYFDCIGINGRPDGADACTYVIYCSCVLAFLGVYSLSHATDFGRCQSAAPRMSGPLACSEVGKQ